METIYKHIDNENVYYTLRKSLPVPLSDFAKDDIATIQDKAKQLAKQKFSSTVDSSSRLLFKITDISVTDDKLTFTGVVVYIKADQFVEAEEFLLLQANEFCAQLDLFLLDNQVATTRNMWELLWRPQIEHLMNQQVTDNVVDNHAAAIMLMVPCIDRAYTLQNPLARPGYTDGMLRHAFPKNDMDMPADKYEQCIKSLHKGLVNGLKHDSFLRHDVALCNDANNQRPFYRRGIQLIVNPWAFWKHVRDHLDEFYKNRIRNPSIGPGTSP